MTHNNEDNNGFRKHLPNTEELARELANAQSIDDFYEKDGVFSRMFSDPLE